MSKHLFISPFIRLWDIEYGTDLERLETDGSRGISYEMWKSVFGDTHDRFMEMKDDDWNFIFKKLFWDPMQGDAIQSQLVANIMVDWMWCSGKKSPAKRLQTVLVQDFGCQIDIDGAIGKQTIRALNSVDEKKLVEAILEERFDFLDDICVTRPQNKKFLKGWQNRINDLMKQFAAARE